MMSNVIVVVTDLAEKYCWGRFLRKIFNAWVIKYSILFNNCVMHE